MHLSSAAKVIGCPGSMTLERRVTLEPDADRERKKLEGRTADWVIAKMLRSDPVFAGEVGPHGLPVTDEMIDGCRLYIDTIREVTSTEPTADCAEVTANLSWLVDDHRRAQPDKNWQITGRSDYRYLYGVGRHLFVFEFKYGHREVEAADNAQLIGAALDEYTLRYVDKATFVVVQPRDLRGETVRRWDVDKATIAVWREKFITAKVDSNRPDAPLCTGKWCKDCNAAGLCPAMEDLLMQQRTVLDAQQTLTPEQVGERLTLVVGLSETATTMKTVLQQQALAMIKGGSIVPGVKVVRGTSRRSLKRVDELEMIATLYGVERSALFVEKPRGLGEIEKILPPSTLDLVTEKPLGALEVVLDGDKRPAAIENNPAAVFGPAQ